MKETLYTPLSNVSVEINNSKRYTSFFTLEEVGCLMDYYQRDKGKLLFDGANMRVDSITHNEGGDIVSLSPITFFDYMTSNALLLYSAKIESYLIQISNYGLLEKFKAFLLYCSKIESEDEILATPFFANLAAVSVLIKDRNNKYGIVQRGSSTILASNYYGVSTSGCIETQDFEKNNPLINCVIRESKEELNVTLNENSIIIHGVAFGKEKLQPIILCNATIANTWEDVFMHMREGVDYQNEVKHFYAVPSEKLGLVLSAGKMSEAARMHVSLQSANNEIYGSLDDFLLA